MTNIISDKQINLLKSYQDKAYVSAILCDKTCSFYLFLKNIFSVPLIITSSIMTICNSMNLDNTDLRYINIIVNASTALTLGLINNFKFQERASNFKIGYIKFNKLVHSIEDSLVNDLENLTVDSIRAYINIYDSIHENIEYEYPNHIKKQVRISYKNERVLPNVLNCQRTGHTPPIGPINTSELVITLKDDDT